MRRLPPWADRFLRAICPEELFEEIEGDLIELYNDDAKNHGARRAKLMFATRTLRFFRPGILFRNKVSFELAFPYMLANYCKFALRVMMRSKSFSMINLTGLSLGVTGALMLFVWIHHEFSYEEFHAMKDRLHIVWNRAQMNGQVQCWSTTPRVLAPTLASEFASVDKAVSFAQWGPTHLFTVGDTRLLKKTGVFADPGILTMLSFPLLKGHPGRALDDPGSIVITEDFARQLFADKDAFGETLTISEGDHSFQFKVTGIMKSLPSNTAFDFEYIIPFSFVESLSGKDTFWGNNSVLTLVMLKKGTDPITVNNQVKDVVKKHYSGGQHIEIFLYPLLKNRLYSRFENGVPSGGRIEVVNLLAILAVCLVAIACINFVNLSTARAQRRSKEVAVRKVTGALRHSLMSQFLLESVVMAFFAGVVSLVICYFTIPYFSLLVSQEVELASVPARFWIWFLAAVFLIGVLAGAYPAFYLSSFSSLRILKGAYFSTQGGSVLRSILVVFQFGFAITLIVAAIVIYRQSDFLKERDAGYSRDHLIYLPLTGDLGKNYLAFRNELISRNLAVSLTKTSTPLTEQWSGTTDMKWKGKNPEERTNIERIFVDEGITKTSSLTLIEGRDMDLERFPSDSSAVLINETALKLMGFEDPIGETISDSGRDWKIIGVVKDFVFTSPFRKIEPIMLFGSKGAWSFSTIYIKLNPDRSIPETLAALAELSSKYNPEYPFEYHFADLEYQRKFELLDVSQKITNIFTSLAIFIACLGLLGLAVYMTEVRRKEIGIRKVLGGTVFNITKLLSVSSLKPIILSIVIFTPLSWFAMQWWLEPFAYRTTLDAWIFLIAAGLILLIAFITISSQTIKAALDNPVDSLRNE